MLLDQKDPEIRKAKWDEVHAVGHACASMLISLVVLNRLQSISSIHSTTPGKWHTNNVNRVVKVATLEYRRMSTCVGNPKSRWDAWVSSRRSHWWWGSNKWEILAWWSRVMVPRVYYTKRWQNLKPTKSGSLRQKLCVVSIRIHQGVAIKAVWVKGNNYMHNRKLESAEKWRPSTVCCNGATIQP